MARTSKKTTTTVEEIKDAEIVKDADPQLEPAALTITEKLAQIIDVENDNFYCRVYREINGRGGGVQREFIGRVDGYLVDDEYLAETYGGGRYFVRYFYTDHGAATNTSGNFVISSEHFPPAGNNKEEQKNGLSRFLERMDEGKMAMIAAGIEMVKKIFAPPPPPDYTKLFEILASNKAQPVSDAVLMKALEGSKQAAAQQPVNILEQVKQLQELKDFLTGHSDHDESDDEEGGETMDLIAKGLKMLPLFLGMNGQNYEATGRQLSNNEYLQDLMAKDPELAQKFVDAARAEYGDENAAALAKGFGLNVTYKQPAAEQPAETGA